ncbi:MAG: NTP transferase domain-containing protein [Rhodospirillales bacterium]
MTRIIASIEARMGSSRLPGKMLLLLAGQPVLAHLTGRMMLCRNLDGLIIATTDNPADDAIAGWAAAHSVPCFRGSEEDVLARVLAAQQSMRSDVVVELCGDTPFLDPAVVDAAVDAWNSQDVDLVTTARNRSYPDGQDVEIFSMHALGDIDARCRDANTREHVSVPFYNEPQWRVHDLQAPAFWHRPELRLVLDTAADARFLGALASAAMIRHGPLFGLDATLAILDASPELKAMHAEALEAAA